MEEQGQNKKAIFSLRIMRLSMIALAVLFALGATAIAQNSDPLDPKRGAANGSSFSLSDIENINLTNGNLSLNMPLASLPKGRGGLSASLGLAYNSKLYKPQVEELADDSSQNLTDQNALFPSEKGGWQFVSSLSFQLKVTNRFQTTPLAECSHGQEAYLKNAYKWKVQVAFPDGSEKEFRPLGYGSEEDGGFWNISPNGKKHSYGWFLWNGYPHCTYDPTQVTTAGMVYYTTDGSYLRLVIDHDQDEIETNNPYTVYFPDGSYFRSTTGRLTDRYGNYLEPVSFQYNGKYANGIGDQLGRKIFTTAGDSPDEVFVYGIGPNGQPIKWTIRYKITNVRRNYRTTGAGSLRMRGGASDQVLLSEWDVVDEIILPPEYGNLKYEFGYNGSDEELRSDEQSDGFGELTYIRLPSGAEAFYEYSIPGWPDPNTYPPNTDFALRNAVSKKTLRYYTEHDGSWDLVEDEWQYAIGPTGSTVTSSDGSVMTQIHGNTAYQDAYSGLVKSIEQANGSKVEKLWGFSGSGATGINPFVKTEFTSIKDDSGNYVKTAIKSFTQDRNGNTTSVFEYDFVPYGDVPRSSGFPTGLPSGIGNPTRAAYTEYYNPTPDSSDTTTQSNYSYWDFTGPRNLTARVVVKNASMQTVSQTEITYDDPLTTANPIMTRTWDSTKGAVSSPLTDSNSVKTQATYNSYGMPLTTTDANGVVTQITYGNIAGPNGNVTDLYPTQTVAAYGTGLARTSTATYDFYTGAVLTTTDVDNGVTNATEYDALGRPTKAITAQGTGLESWTTTEYDDVNRRVVVRSDLETKGDGRKVATQFFDQLGRVRLAKTLEDPFTQSPYNETDGIKVQTRYKTVAGYTYQLSSNPFRAATSSAETDPTMGWTRSKTWNHRRKKEIETYSGSELPFPWGSNADTTGKASTDVEANTRTITDQSGRKRRGISDSLGRMVEVIEDPDGQNLSTTYVFDVLGNLRNTSQGEQNRYFMFSSLGRLLFAKQPEQSTNNNLTATDPVTSNTNWSVKYAYDNNGNITSTTDAANRTISATYDALGRIVLRDYSDASTPDVTFYYDGQYLDANNTLQTAPGAVTGKLTCVSTSVSRTNYTSFDAVGRLLSHQQITDGQVYSTSYAYDLSGSLVEETYPSGRVVKNLTDSIGRLQEVKSKKNSSFGFHTYVGNVSYNSVGAVTKMQLGNGSWETTSYNSRLQITQIGVGSTDNSQNILKLEFGFGTPSQNNGSLREQKITIPTIGESSGFTAIQTYTYDGLNRLQSATEEIDETETWKQTFQYDRYGNRRFNTDNNNTTTLPESFDPAIYNPSISTANNKFSSGQGYSYDATGNLTVDAVGRQYFYNAENQQKEIKDHLNNTLGAYIYDGDGRRIKKITAAETTIFVYNALGQLVAEYSTQVETADPKVSYLTTDHLGSPRVITDKNGQIISRKDYSPFGEETITAQRTQALGYASPTVRQDFTGYENDEESGLQYAQARYFSPGHGRFTTVDPLTASASIRDPQTFNRYTYALNSPYKFTDPLGLAPGTPGYEARIGEEEYEQRLQNTLDVNRGNRLAAEGDEDGARAICAQNPHVECVESQSEGSVTAEATVNSPSSDEIYFVPFVISNAAALIEQASAETHPGYVDDKNFHQCALLPLAWENEQYMWLTRKMSSTSRTTPNWFQGGQVKSGMRLQRGTVLASGWVNGKYTNKPPGSEQGNHVVIFDTWGTKNGKKGMWVIEQVGGPPVRNFKPFGEGNHVTNASEFHVVMFRRVRMRGRVY